MLDQPLAGLGDPKANCIEEAFSYLRGRAFKTAASEAGTPHLWPAPQPVLRAIAILHWLSEGVSQFCR
jgi:hypothetical protein